ncbi:hypothetical protein H0901_14710 [Microcystis aeruginosa BLCCF158]|uniref:Uncharacterized protein n=1 Tax=Microcystis aeruginosa BLCC-F158 TaxID=2755316 RepID=A0A841V6T1_MICAE|nr:hypothetical protein [Microcystis aeruginosa]MBC1196467.1 hypothetical protein [Microcystis aeruginosa BLCC-F158]
MKCPECKSGHINKNGHRGQKQNYSGFQSAEVQKLWVLGKGQEAKGKKNRCSSLA